MKLAKKTFKIWWGWNSSKIEDYLEEMAKQGWRLVTVSFGMTVFEFVRDDKQKIRYAFDYNINPSDEYMIILKDSGWKYVSKSAGWILWSRNYTEIRESLFTDNQSLIDRNKRLIIFLSIIASFQIPILMMNIVDRDYSEHALLSTVIWIFYGTLLLFLVYGLIRLLIANKKLKSQGRR